MNAFNAAAAMIPLLFYLGYLAWMNRRGAVRVVSGPVDVFALGAGLMGFVFIGPMQMLVPIDALIARGWIVWLMMGTLYLLAVALIGLSRRPRLTIYNIAPERARESFRRFAAALDSEAQFAGDAAYLPRGEMELLLDVFPATGSAQLLLRRPTKDATWRRRFERLAIESFTAGGDITEARPFRFCFTALFFLTAAGVTLLTALYPGEILYGLLYYLYS